MMVPFKTILASLALSCCLFGAALADTLKLADGYSVSGTTVDGSPYSGAAEVAITSGTTFEVTWRIGGATYKGFGMRWDDVLAVSYAGGNVMGVAIYQVDKDSGVLNGRWTIAGQPGSGTEKLSPR
jgi:hypothetical protein